METIRIGIIGHGFMGHEHESMLTRLDGYKVVGISDIDPKQLEDVKFALVDCTKYEACVGKELSGWKEAAFHKTEPAAVHVAGSRKIIIICKEISCIIGRIDVNQIYLTFQMPRNNFQKRIIIAFCKDMILRMEQLFKIDRGKLDWNYLIFIFVAVNF